jgi:hypothetical protein
VCLPNTINPIYFFQIVARNLASGHWPVFGCDTIKVTLGGHSALDPPLPIPNRAVKRSRADDSMHSYAKVGHCQAPNNKKPRLQRAGAFYRQLLPLLSAPSGAVRRVSYGRRLPHRRRHANVARDRLNNSSGGFPFRRHASWRGSEAISPSRRRVSDPFRKRQVASRQTLQAPLVNLAWKQIEAGWLY